MAITRSINYIQNVPISLGFSNVLTSAPTDVVSVAVDFATPISDSKMGRFIFTDVENVTVNYSYFADGTTNASGMKIIGTTTDVNTLLNTMQFVNHFYDADNLDQDFLTTDRVLPTDKRGELMIQISPDAVHGLSVGDTVKIESSGLFTITAIDSVVCATRIWMVYNRDYDISSMYYGSEFTSPAIGKYLQTSGAVNISPIIDIAYNNPHGQVTINISASYVSSGIQFDSGTITLNGSFFINEPTFATLSGDIPVTAPETGTYINFGSIAQAEGNYQSVQVMFKYLENDPKYLSVDSYSLLPGYPTAGTEDEKQQFIGDAILAKAKLNTAVYISGTAVGNLGITQSQDRIADAPSADLIRWHFYGTPDECNNALSSVYFYRAPGVIKDFKYEVRIINGRTRIYNARGK